MDQRSLLCRLLWACINQWSAQHSKRNRSWGDDLHASTRPWGFQG